MDENQRAPLETLATALLDRLTGHPAGITYQAENLEVVIPGKEGAASTWKIHGTLKIRTGDADR
ncbi:hypothetical protein [Haloferula sargassicola]|uniref:Halobacterial output domain-containing protein n=1 Tax=Haloferula sargassicola TaxID=490096 RepID=A0ABP9UTV2_9BACT